MRNLLVVPFVLIFSFFTAQNAIDFNDIEAKVTDSAGAYFYEKMIYKFGHLPATLDSMEAKYLYYGQSFGAKDKKMVPIGDFLEKAREKKYKEAIEEGEKILKQEPVNFEVLGTLVQLYEKSDKENHLFPLRIAQFKILMDAVLNSVEQKEEDKLYTVMSVTDEYMMGSILNYNLYTMRRKSDHVSNGIIDHWKSGKKKISFLVFYPKDK